MGETLKPCPFCGDPQKYDERAGMFQHAKQTEGCPLRQFASHDVAAWNRRAVEAELLQELEGVVHFADGFRCYHSDGPAGQELRRWINGARAAIAKATGES